MISSRMNTLSHMQSLPSRWLEMLKGTRTPFLQVEHPNPGFITGNNFNNALYGPIAIRSNFFSFNLIRLDVFWIFFYLKVLALVFHNRIAAFCIQRRRENKFEFGLKIHSTYQQHKKWFLEVTFKWVFSSPLWLPLLWIPLKWFLTAFCAFLFLRKNWIQRSIKVLWTSS